MGNRMSFYITHMNAEIQKFFSDSEFRLNILNKIKNSTAPKPSSTCYFYYYLKTIDGTMLYKVLKGGQNVSRFDHEYELAPLRFKAENENIYSVTEGGKYHIVSQPKELDYIKNEMKSYLDKRWQAILRGDRYNCDTSLSETLPYLYNERYYNYVSGKIHAKSKPKNAGDGVLINHQDNVIEEVEVKFTASGGCRQTFSPNQLDKVFVIASISRADLDTATKQLSRTNFATLPIDFYYCKDKFIDALKEEVQAKNERRKNGGGTGRYEISNMIKKMESFVLYCDKKTKVMEL